MDNRFFPAHIRRESDVIIEQTVDEHCRGAAKYAAEALHGIGLEKTGSLLGLVHDCGKMTQCFSDYIRRAANGEPVRRGSVNHTFAAVKLLLTRFHEAVEDPYQPLEAELLAYAVGAHHGLFDCFGPDRRNGFEHRLTTEKELFLEASGNYHKLCITEDELEHRFSETCKELNPVMEKIISIGQRDQTGDEMRFYFGNLCRLLLSALVDGDRKDTAEFMNGGDLPTPKQLTKENWKVYLERVEAQLAKLPAEKEIQQARAILSKKCRERATVPDGVYRLNMPTGAGKTLGSLRFALAHAAEYGKSRIIFTSPLLSILEQNADVIRKYLGDNEIVLEHHSNIIRAEEDGDELSMQELLTETWESPVIITTLVQLLNTLFSGEITAVRRFHSLCNSVIVIDEVQTIPIKMLSLFQLTATFLTEICGTTIVLCSATQPPQEDTAHPFLTEPVDLVPYDEKIWKMFRRTVLQEAKSCPLGEISYFAGRILEQTDSLLIVCNKKDEAAAILTAMREMDADFFHLSAAMCVAHRRDTLNALNHSLKCKQRKTVCVSTQVIEAGVDISFGCVIRLAAGMDNVVQAAGRCNRNGESEEPAPVYILNCSGESLSHLQEIQRAKNATVALLAEYKKNDEAFSSDLASEQAIRQYYSFLYKELPEESMDYPTDKHGTLYELLSSNIKYCDTKPTYFLNQAFQTAGKDFCVFDTQSETLLVPYREGAEIIARLRRIGDRYDTDAQKERRRLLQLAKPYTVTVYEYQIKQLEKQGAIDRICHDSILVLQPNYFGEIQYSSETGLITREG